MTFIFFCIWVSLLTWIVLKVGRVVYHSIKWLNAAPKVLDDDAKQKHQLRVKQILQENETLDRINNENVDFFFREQLRRSNAS